MYTVKGYVGSEKKLKQYFAENVFEGKTRVVFVADEILPDHIRNCRKITLPFKALDTIVPGVACCAGFHVNPCEIFI